MNHGTQPRRESISVTSSENMRGETRSSSVSPKPQCTTDMSKKDTRLRTGATFQQSTTAPIIPRYTCASAMPPSTGHRP